MFTVFTSRERERLGMCRWVNVRMCRCLYGKAYNKETLHFLDEGFNFKIGHRPTLPHFTAVPSALAGLTSLFGMGRGGHRRYRHLKAF